MTPAILLHILRYVYDTEYQRVFLLSTKGEYPDSHNLIQGDPLSELFHYGFSADKAANVFRSWDATEYSRFLQDISELDAKVGILEYDTVDHMLKAIVTEVVAIDMPNIMLPRWFITRYLEPIKAIEPVMTQHETKLNIPQDIFGTQGSDTKAFFKYKEANIVFLPAVNSKDKVVVNIVPVNALSAACLPQLVTRSFMTVEDAIRFIDVFRAYEVLSKGETEAIHRGIEP